MGRMCSSDAEREHMFDYRNASGNCPSESGQMAISSDVVEMQFRFLSFGCRTKG